MAGKRFALTGGQWLSAYDGKTTSRASDLDVDHKMSLPAAEIKRLGVGI